MFKVLLWRTAAPKRPVEDDPIAFYRSLHLRLPIIKNLLAWRSQELRGVAAVVIEVEVVEGLEAHHEAAEVGAEVSFLPGILSANIAEGLFSQQLGID